MRWAYSGLRAKIELINKNHVWIRMQLTTPEAEKWT
jgi:hypothetical protein